MPRSASRALVRLNTQAIRAKALQSHRRAERALEKLRADLKRYHERDVPGFRAWLHRTFGPLLARQREYQQALAEKLALLDEMKAMVERYGLSCAEAYRKVMWRRAHPEAAEAEEAEERRQAADTRRRREQAPGAERPEDDREWDEDLDDDDDIFSDDEIDAWLEELLDQDGSPRDGRAPPPDQTTARELYRRIVRQLHPDHHGQLSEPRATLWHEAQAAYRRRDLNALQSILARCNDGVAALGAHTPVSLILRLTRHLAKATRTSRSELRGAKRDLAWHYEERIDDRRYLRKVERDVQEVVDQSRRLLDDLNRDLAELEREANRQGQRKPPLPRRPPRSARPSRPPPTM